MNCDQRRDLMPLLLLDGLEPAEAAALRAHLATGCTRAEPHLAEADATLAFLPYALDAARPSAGAKARLMARLGNHAELTPPREATRRQWTSGWLRRIAPAAVAACITFVATATYMMHVQHRRDEAFGRQLANERQELASREQSNRELVTQTSLLRSPSLRLIRMDGGAAQPRASARALWDANRQAWHFYAYNLEQLAPREAYELWFVTPYGRKVPAATFRPNELGNAYLVTTLPKDVGPVSSAFVTDEPAVGTFQPTGTTHLSGKLE